MKLEFLPKGVVIDIYKKVDNGQWKYIEKFKYFKDKFSLSTNNFVTFV